MRPEKHRQSEEGARGFFPYYEGAEHNSPDFALRGGHDG